MRRFVISLMVVIFVFGFVGGVRAEGIKGFAIGARPIWYIAPGLDGFEAQEGRTEWTIEGFGMFGAAPYLQIGFTENIGIEGAYDFLFGSDLSLYVGSVSAVAMFLTDGDFNPYIKGGVCYGEFDWDGPGEFDAEAGFQAGAGFESSIGEHFGIGLDLLYRNLKNDYDPKEGVSDEDSIDLSGVSIGVNFTGRF